MSTLSSPFRHTTRILGSLALLASLVACGGESGTASSEGGLAGHWQQQTGSDEKGMTLEFDGASDKLMVHTAPAEDGSHGHLSGTYTLDAETGAVTVQCALSGAGKSEQWEGEVAAETLTLTGGDETLRFGKIEGYEHK